MRSLIIHGCVALLIAGCGSDGEDDGNGNGNGDKSVDSGGTDATAPDGPTTDAAPDVSVDSPPTGCYECSDPGGLGFSLCRARDTTDPFCVFGDGRAGDTCTADVHCTTGHCLTPSWDDVGFCTVTCDTDWDCPNNGRCLLTDGVDDFCAWLCVNESHCPPGEYPIPLPDMGVIPDAPPEYCYDSCTLVTGVDGRACHANQLKVPGCVFGDFRPGDLCQPGVSPCQCVYFGDDTLGFCTEDCPGGAGDCSFDAECVDNGTPSDTSDDYCIYICGGVAGTDHTTCPNQ